MDDTARRAYRTRARQKLSALGRVLKRERRLRGHIKNARLECFSLAAAMHFAPPLYGVHYRSTRHRDLFDVSFYDCHNSFNPSRLSILAPLFYSCRLPLRRRCGRSRRPRSLLRIQIARTFAICEILLSRSKIVCVLFYYYFVTRYRFSLSPLLLFSRSTLSHFYNNNIIIITLTITE